MSDTLEEQPGFAPHNPTDGREKGDWKSRYPAEAHAKIRTEGIYLAIVFIACPILLFSIFTDFFSSWTVDHTVKKYAYGWLGGTFGGAIFGIKWLYHSVAKNLWNIDRRLWRIYTPHLSGGFAFAFIVLISSGIFNIFSPEAVEKPSTVFGLGFLVGYFSDSAVGKLTEVANTIFGATEKHSGKKT
jgi:hypothetical protein